MSEDYLGIDHIGVAVNDLDAAVHTYGDVPGLHMDGGDPLPMRGLKVASCMAALARVPSTHASHLFTPKLATACCPHG